MAAVILSLFSGSVRELIACALPVPLEQLLHQIDACYRWLKAPLQPVFFWDG
jgi:hypothetical protein